MLHVISYLHAPNEPLLDLIEPEAYQLLLLAAHSTVMHLEAAMPLLHRALA